MPVPGARCSPRAPTSIVAAACVVPDAATHRDPVDPVAAAGYLYCEARYQGP